MRSNTGFVFAVAIGASVAFSLSIHAQDSPTAEALLKGLEDSLTRTRRSMAFDAETHVVYSGAYNWDAVPTERTVQATVRRDKEYRYDVTMTEDLQYAKARSSKLRVPLVRRDRRMWNGDEGMRYDASGAKPPSQLFVRADEPDRFLVGAYGALDAGRYLDGVIAGDDKLFLWESMRQGDLRLKNGKETVDGHETYVLESKSKYGTTTVWIDPESGNCPRRVVIQKGVGDYWGSEALGTPVDPPPPGAISKDPVSPLVAVEVEVNVSQIEYQGGSYVPTEGAIRVRRSFGSGQVTEFQARHRRTNIDMAPDFDKLGAFKMDVPNGTPVVFLDKRGLTGVRFEWRDGQVIPSIDENYVGQLDKTIGEIATEVAVGREENPRVTASIPVGVRAGSDKTSEADLGQPSLGTAARSKWFISLMLGGMFCVLGLALVCRKYIWCRKAER